MMQNDETHKAGKKKEKYLQWQSFSSLKQETYYRDTIIILVMK